MKEKCTFVWRTQLCVFLWTKWKSSMLNVNKEPIIVFFGFNKRIFTRKCPFSARRLEFGFCSVMRTVHTDTHKHTQHCHKHTQVKHIVAMPRRFFSYLSAPFPSTPLPSLGIDERPRYYEWPAFQALELQTALMTLLDTWSGRVCVELNLGGGHESNRLRESFMKICCKLRSRSSSTWNLREPISKSSVHQNKNKTQQFCAKHFLIIMLYLLRF